MRRNSLVGRGRGWGRGALQPVRYGPRYRHPAGSLCFHKEEQADGVAPPPEIDRDLLLAYLTEKAVQKRLMHGDRDVPFLGLIGAASICRNARSLEFTSCIESVPLLKLTNPSPYDMYSNMDPGASAY